MAERTGDRKARERQKRLQRKEDRKVAVGWRILGVLLGLLIGTIGAGALLYNVVLGVQLTGLVGERGTLTVEYCYKAGGTHLAPDYNCHGTYDPDSPEYALREGMLEDTEDQPKGEQVRVIDNPFGSHGAFRETGVLATLGRLWWLCFGVALTAIGFFVTRKWARSFVR